jgi:hypothetical protein
VRDEWGMQLSKVISKPLIVPGRVRLKSTFKNSDFLHNWPLALLKQLKVAQ